jgi:hypothetical protein
MLTYWGGVGTIIAVSFEVGLGECWVYEKGDYEGIGFAFDRKSN